ncbi:peptide-binding protein [Sagittula sp. P11]|jgi:uncharacterized protein YraI|uniref:SH3 domain-containing protein n=1 Tax=unclassified Sagittula TaxID=2624628 RepID=UPI000C2CFFAC|nr:MULTISPECIES: SH3 domain-containing protein [unclassified Sagittula]AUC53721.1 peptide-binding protein [Sagittula sp. P11]WHZ35348.1 SH3 domain-containing protein [Sagittula sp. MA-2]
MRKVILGAMVPAVAAALVLAGATPAAAQWRERYEVFGVEGDDMLKMREGPGTGYVVIVGLPNGTVVRVLDCQRTGATKWCEVGLDRAMGLRGFVSEAYLRKM